MSERSGSGDSHHSRQETPIEKEVLETNITNNEHVDNEGDHVVVGTQSESAISQQIPSTLVETALQQQQTALPFSEFSEVFDRNGNPFMIGHQTSERQPWLHGFPTTTVPDNRVQERPTFQYRSAPSLCGSIATETSPLMDQWFMDDPFESQGQWNLEDENIQLMNDLEKANQLIEQQKKLIYQKTSDISSQIWYFVPSIDLCYEFMPMLDPKVSIEPYECLNSLEIRLSRNVHNVNVFIFLPLRPETLLPEENLQRIVQLATMRTRKLTLVPMPPAKSLKNWESYLHSANYYINVFKKYNGMQIRLDVKAFEQLCGRVDYPIYCAPGAVCRDEGNGKCVNRKFTDWMEQLTEVWIQQAIVSEEMGKIVKDLLSTKPAPPPHARAPYRSSNRGTRGFNTRFHHPYMSGASRPRGRK